MNNKSQRTTVDKSTFQNVNVITEERLNVFPPTSCSPGRRGGKSLFLSQCIVVKGINPLRGSKAKSVRKYTFALISTSFSGALIDGSPHPHPLLRQSLTMPFQSTTLPNPLSSPFNSSENKKTAKEYSRPCDTKTRAFQR